MNDHKISNYTVGIVAIGTATPATSLSQRDACEWAKDYCPADGIQHVVLEKLYRKTQIDSRAVVVSPSSGEQTSIDDFYPLPSSPADLGPSTRERMLVYNRAVADLAIKSCLDALERGKMRADKITHLITVSCTGFGAPGFDVRLARDLNLGADVPRTHVAFMGCHGAFNGLRVAHATCATEPDAVVLLCAAEVCSVHFQYGANAQNVVANALFADGSAALIMQAGSGVVKYQSAKSLIVQDSEEAMTWSIIDTGFVMTLSAAVPFLIEKHLPAFMQSWLAENGLVQDEIKSWVVHPGGPRILDAVERALKLDKDALRLSRQILSTHGNMSSPTVLFILEHMLEQKSPGPCVMLGFGPGLTVEAILLR